MTGPEPNKSLQRTLDPAAPLPGGKAPPASSAPERWRYTSVLRWNIVVAIALLPCLLLLSTRALSEPCPLASVGEEFPESHPICLFYSGTDHFRNNRMAQASSSWDRLLQLESYPDEYTDLRVDSLNNIGYLYFYGLGVETDKHQALKNWKEAVSLGHSESEYHLCHAYADRDQSTFDRVAAEEHCTRALDAYLSIEEPDDDDLAVLQIIREYLADL